MCGPDDGAGLFGRATGGFDDVSFLAPSSADFAPQWPCCSPSEFRALARHGQVCTWCGVLAQGCIARGEGTPSPPPRRPAYAQPLSDTKCQAQWHL